MAHDDIYASMAYGYTAITNECIGDIVGRLSRDFAECLNRVEDEAEKLKEGDNEAIDAFLREYEPHFFE